MRPRRSVENGQEYLYAERKDKATFSVSPSTIRNKTGRKRIRCRSQSINAHAEQERSEFSRSGNRDGLRKSDDGCYSQRRSANKRRSDRVRLRIGFVRDSKASRRYTGSSLTWKSLRHHGYSHEWTSGQRPQLIKDGRRIKCSTGNHVPIVVPGLSTGSSSSTTHTSSASQPQEAPTPTSRPASTRNESKSSQARGDLLLEPTETENTHENQDTELARRGLLRDLPEWLQEFLENLVGERVPVHTDAPASLSRVSFRAAEKWYRVSTVLKLTSRRTDTATS